MRPRVARALAYEALPHLQLLGVAFGRIVRIRRQQLQCLRRTVGLDLVNDAVLRLDQGRQFRQHHPAHGRQIALPLQHVGEAREIGLEPILLGVAVRGQA